MTGQAASPPALRTRSGDNAIRSRAADRLGRARFAGHLAATLLAEAADEGLVVALVGPWGQGKTSVLNMVREQLEGDGRVVLAFNPWMFSGRDQLVAAFFEQVAGQLRLKGKAGQALAGRLLSYGQALAPLSFVPLAGPWIARASAAASVIARLRGTPKAPDPVERQREVIEAELGGLPEPIFVFIDDIDRLTAPEIRDMLSLVRLAAHFPKVIYLLAFDRAKVESALDADTADSGRSYLDKIVELSFDLPATSQPALRDLLLRGIEQAATGVRVGPFDRELWPEVLTDVLVPLLATPRHVNRYLAALPAALTMIGDEVALVDVLALEAVRMRLPEVFALLGPMSQPLTDAGMLSSRMPGWQSEIDTIVDAGRENAGVVRCLCRLLFPATGRYLGNTIPYSRGWLAQWRRQRRVASPEVLSTYLSRQLPPGTLPVATVDAVVAAMPDQHALQAMISGMSPDDLDDLLTRLAGYDEKDIPLEAVQPACTVLLGLYPRLRTGPPSMLEAGTETVLDRVIVQLLRRVGDVTERTQIIEALCADVQGLTGKIRLLRAAGRRSNPPSGRLIPPADSDRLFRAACREIRHATAAQLTAERNPLWLLATALEEDPADRGNLSQVLADDDLARALLLSALAEAQWIVGGPEAAGDGHELRWQLLGTVVGDDASITALVNRVAACFPGDEAAAAVTGLACRYLSGWRPPDSLLAGQPPAVRQASNYPGMVFSPREWPAFLIRSAATYEVDPAWVARGDVSGGEFHRRLAEALASLPLATQVAALAEGRGLPVGISEWRPDAEATQIDRIAVQRLAIGPPDQPSATLRYAVFLPDRPGGPVKLMTDIAVSPKQDTDAKWGQLSLEEVRDVLAGAIEPVAGPMAGQLLRSIYDGEEPPRATVELYLWPPQGESDRSLGMLDKTINLEPLGTPARTDRPPQQGMFAAAGDTPVATPEERCILVVHALIRMSRDWGYLDAQDHLGSLASR